MKNNKLSRLEFTELLQRLAEADQIERLAVGGMWMPEERHAPAQFPVFDG